MKPARFEYLAVGSVRAALELLDDDTKVLAGGQSIVPLLNFRLARPERLVDINRVPGLSEIAVDGTVLRVGALVRQQIALESDEAARRVPLVAQALRHVGHYVTRNRGTVGGSLAHGDASAELPLVLRTLGGSVRVVGSAGERVVDAEQFFHGHFQTALAPDELVLETLWPVRREGECFGFRELAPRHGDYAIAMAACRLRRESGGGSAVVGVGAVADRPLLVGPLSFDGELSRETAGELGHEVERELGEAMRHDDEAVRPGVVAALTARALHDAWSDTEPAAA